MPEPAGKMEVASEKEAGSTLVLRRQIYTQQLLENRYSTAASQQRPSLRDKVKSAVSCSKRNPWQLLTSYLPVIKVIKSYRIRDYILADALAGLSVSFLRLSAALAFGILASLRPVNGLYSTFFPVLTYIIFGTSPYISFGPNAILALLTRPVVEREADMFRQSFTQVVNGSETITAPTEDEIMAVKVGASMACCLVAGLFMLGFGLFKLGFLTSYLSKSFIEGFMTAAAIHVLSSQVPPALGITPRYFTGPGNLVRLYIDCFSRIRTLQLADLIIAVTSIVTLLLVKICVNERYQSKMKAPVPIELIVVVVGTIIAHLAKLDENFGVSVVGPVPSGFPAPTTSIPSLVRSSRFFADCFVIAIMVIILSITVDKLTAHIHCTNTYDSQEFIAYGMCNVISGFFSSFPTMAGVASSMVLSSLGVRTTLHGIPVAIFFVLTLLWIGHLFVSLPLSILAAVVIVAMKDLLLQFRNLRRIWTINRYDFIIWTVTCAVSVFVDLDYGIIAGVGASILLVVIQTQLVAGSLLGVVRKEDLILDIERYAGVGQLEGAKIFRFSTPLYFATAYKFKNQIYKEVLDPSKVRKDLLKKATKTSDKTSRVGVERKQELKEDVPKVGVTESEDQKLRTIVLDCRVMTYLDMSGLAMLEQVINTYKEINVSVYLAGCPRRFLQVLRKADFFDNFPEEHVFVDVFDAIQEFRVKTLGDLEELYSEYVDCLFKTQEPKASLN